MRTPSLWLGVFLAAALSAAAPLKAQVPPSEGQAPGNPPPGGPGRWGPGARQGRGLFGKISAITSDSIEVTGDDGKKTTVKLTGSTEFRRDRQPAKASDFKVGDTVMVRTGGPEEAGAPTAVLVAGGQGFAGRGGPFALPGTLGKDYVVGEVKTVDPP